MSYTGLTRYDWSLVKCNNVRVTKLVDSVRVYSYRVNPYLMTKSNQNQWCRLYLYYKTHCSEWVWPRRLYTDLAAVFIRRVIVVLNVNKRRISIQRVMGLSMRQSYNDATIMMKVSCCFNNATGRQATRLLPNSNDSSHDLVRWPSKQTDHHHWWSSAKTCVLLHT